MGKKEFGCIVIKKHDPLSYPVQSLGEFLLQTVFTALTSQVVILFFDILDKRNDSSRELRLAVM
jgi:hypothetical protein